MTKLSNEGEEHEAVPPSAADATSAGFGCRPTSATDATREARKCKCKCGYLGLSTTARNYYLAIVDNRSRICHGPFCLSEDFPHSKSRSRCSLLNSLLNRVWLMPYTRSLSNLLPVPKSACITPLYDRGTTYRTHEISADCLQQRTIQRYTLPSTHSLSAYPSYCCQDPSRYKVNPESYPHEEASPSPVLHSGCSSTTIQR